MSTARRTDRAKNGRPPIRWSNARVTLLEKPDSPGHYEARFFLRPHYQLEGLTAVLRIVSRLPTA